MNKTLERRRFKAMVRESLQGKQAPSYIDDILKAVRSWLAYNYIELKRKIKIANSDIAVTLQKEMVETPFLTLLNNLYEANEFAKFIQNLDRARYFASLCIYSLLI